MAPGGRCAASAGRGAVAPVQDGARRAVGALRSALRRAGGAARREPGEEVALCERAEALADSTNWLQTAEEIKGCRREWKAIGPVTRGQEKAIWERFRAACDRFFTRRQDDLAKRKAIWAENFAKKEALCLKVEALAESTDWERGGRRNQAAAGRVEDDRAGEEEPIGCHLAAIPRRLRRVLRALRAAARHRARRTRGGARGDLRRARSACASVVSDSATATTQAPAPAGEARRLRQRKRLASAGPGATVRTLRTAGSRNSPRAASIAMRRPRSTGVTPKRVVASSRAGRPASPARIWIPRRTASRMEALVKRVEELAASLGGRPVRRRALVADRSGSRRCSRKRWRRTRSAARSTSKAAAAPRRKRCVRRRRAGRASARPGRGTARAGRSFPARAQASRRTLAHRVSNQGTRQPENVVPRRH